LLLIFTTPASQSLAIYNAKAEIKPIELDTPFV